MQTGGSTAPGGGAASSKLFSRYAERIRAIAALGAKGAEVVAIAGTRGVGLVDHEVDSVESEATFGVQATSTAGRTEAAQEPDASRHGAARSAEPSSSRVSGQERNLQQAEQRRPAGVDILEPRGTGSAAAAASLGAVSSRATRTATGSAQVTVGDGLQSVLRATTQPSDAPLEPLQPPTADGSTIVAEATAREQAASDAKRLRDTARTLIDKARELASKGAGPKSRQLEREAAHLISLARTAEGQKPGRRVR